MKSSSQLDHTAYHREQLAAWQALLAYWALATPAERQMLRRWAAEYLSFRHQTARFLSHHFQAVCTQTCYQDKTSACCSKDGIIIFFADLVNNLLVSGETLVAELIIHLEQPASTRKCIYLGPGGCLWQLKPIVCEMFLCDTALSQVLIPGTAVVAEWEVLQADRKRFTWPDRPVLFDRLESHFMAAGLTSPLMYLHNSPGLLRVKQRAGQSKTT